MPALALDSQTVAMGHRDCPRKAWAPKRTRDLITQKNRSLDRFFCVSRISASSVSA